MTSPVTSKSLGKEFWILLLAVTAGVLLGIALCWFCRLVEIYWPLLEHAVVSLLTAWAWPLTVILVTSLFRRPIADLLRRLKSSKSPLGDQEFFHDLERAEEQARDVVTAAAESTSPVSGPAGDRVQEDLALIRANSVSGRAAMLNAWDYIHKAAAELATKFDLAGSNPYRIVGKHLRKRGALRSEEMALLDDLRRTVMTLRRHEGLLPPTDDVDRYFDLAETMVKILRERTAAAG